MKKYLKIDLYANGFDATQLNCVDLPIAGASGYYNYNNYYYYCFYHCVLNNWGTVNNDWLRHRNYILSKLGLSLNQINVENSSSFISLIRSEIDKKHPLLMLVSYYSLFYHIGYLDNEYRHIPHGIILNGYESEKSLINIKEYTHIENDIRYLTNSYLFCDLQLTEDIVRDIWIKSNEIFNLEGKNNFIALYSIESIGKPKINSYEDLLADTLENIDIKSDKLAEFIKNFNSYFNNNRSKLSNVEGLKKTYVNSLNMLFDVLERTFYFLGQNQELSWKYYSVKDDYLRTRSLILNKLIANIFRGKTISEATEKKLISQILTSNSELFSFIGCLKKDKIKTLRELPVHFIHLTEQIQVRGGKHADTILNCTNLLIVQGYPEPDRNWEVFLKFDLSNLKSEKCLNAKLKIYCNDLLLPTPVEVYSTLDDQWLGTEITWNNKPALDATLTSSQIVNNQKTWYSFDITALVNRKLSINKIISLYLRVEPKANTGANFYSKNASTNQPVLEIIPVQSS